MSFPATGLARALRELDLALCWLETGLIVCLFGALVVLGLGLLVADATGHFAPGTVRGLIGIVLTWLVMMGGARMTARGEHPAVRLACVRRSGTGRVVTQVGIPMLCGLACLALAWAGWKFLVLDISLGSSSQPGVPTWAALIAVPVGFAVMTARFLAQAAGAVVKIGRSRSATG